MKTRTFPVPLHAASKPKPRKASPAQQLKAAFPAFVEYQRLHWDGLTIVLPLAPQMGNFRGHWTVKESARQAYFGHCRMIDALRLLPPRPAPVPAMSVITVTVYVKRLHDLDNLTARLKYSLDALERDGYIKSDSPKHLQYSAMPTQALCLKTPPRVEVTIEPASGGGGWA